MGGVSAKDVTDAKCAAHVMDSTCTSCLACTKGIKVTLPKGPASFSGVWQPLDRSPLFLSIRAGMHGVGMKSYGVEAVEKHCESKAELEAVLELLTNM